MAFRFEAAEDFTRFVQYIAAAVNAILKNQSKERSDKYRIK